MPPKKKGSLLPLPTTDQGCFAMEEINMKMNHFIFCADCILKDLKHYSFLDNNPQSENLAMELRLLTIFVIYTFNLGGTGTVTGTGTGTGTDAAEVVPGTDTVTVTGTSIDIQAAITQEWDLKAAYTIEGRAAVITELQEKISLFRPRVKAAYERLIITISSHNHNSNNHNYNLWTESLERNLLYLGHTSPVVAHLCAMCRMLSRLGYFLQSHPSEYTFLSTHFEAVLVRAAHISYTCWVDRTTSDDESIAASIQEFTQKCTSMLLDLLNEFKPNTPQVIQVCLQLLNNSSSSSSSSQQSGSRGITFSLWVQNLVEFLIPEQDGVQILRYGVKNLILFLNHGPNLYKEDGAAYVELLSKDITSALIELGCFLYSSLVNTTNPALGKLLVEMELLKLDVFLMDLLNLKPNYRRKLDYHTRDFSNVLSFLKTFVGDASQGNSKYPKPIRMHIEAMVREASSVYHSFNDRSISKDEATDKLLSLLDQTKLFKMELLLDEELLNMDSSLMVNAKNEIEIVYEGLMLLGTFLRGPLEENGKLILKRVESVAKEIASICCSFHACRITGDWERIFSHLLPDLVQKVKPVSAEIKETYLQVRRSSRANLPKTDGFGFIDFLLENLRELMNSNADLIAPVRLQIHIVQREIEFLRSFLTDITEAHKVHSDLENLVSCCIQVALEAEYVLDPFVVGGGVLWYHVLWLSDLIEDINLIKTNASKITKKKDGMGVYDESLSQSLLKGIAPVKIPKTDEVVIDLADQTELMIDRLTRRSLLQDVVSIVGMRGPGETTLAKKGCFAMEEIKMKMNCFIVCADCILKDLKHYSFLDNNPQSENLAMELRLLTIFVIYTFNLGGTGTVTGTGTGTDAAEVVPGTDTVTSTDTGTDTGTGTGTDIQAAITQEWDLKAAYTIEGRAAVITELQEEISLFRPRVKAAYERLIITISSHNHNSNNHNYNLWTESLERNLLYLGHTSPVVAHLCAMCRMLSKLGYFLQSHPSEYTFLSTHFEAVLVRAAHISYTCWVDRTTSDDESIAATMQEFTQKWTSMLLDILNEFKPNTPQVIQMCLKLLNNSSSSSSSQQSGSRGITFSLWVQNLVEFLIPEQDGVQILRYGVKNLIIFLNHGPNLYKEDGAAYVELLSKDITSALIELGCFLYSSLVNTTNPALGKLLVEMELLKLDVFLMDLLNLKPNYRRKLDYHSRDFSNVLSFLKTFEGDASQGNSKYPKPIQMHIEAMVREASSVYHSFNNRSISKDEATDKLLSLLDQTKLFKMELLLEEELLNMDSSLMVNAKNEIEIVCEGLMLLGTFLRGPLEENGKLFLKRVESVAKEIASICCSFHASRITGDWERIFSHLLPDLVQKVKPVSAEIKETYLQVRRSSRANLPKTDGFGFIDFLLENLRELMNSNADLIAPVRLQIHIVQREIEFLRSFLTDIAEAHKVHSDLENLVSGCIQVALEAEYVLDPFVVGDGVLWYHVLWLSDLIEDINLIKTNASEITKKKDGMRVYDESLSQSLLKGIAPVKIPKTDEVMIDLADQTELMIGRLTRGSLQQDVVSIVGMPGLGKTTLAKKVYNDPSVTYHFHIRAWCCVSQVYQKRELLLEILGDIVELTDNILEMCDEDLELKLYQCLKRKRYLIVMDDLWSIEAWNGLERSFPNDDNGSRILITSRLLDVASRTKADSVPHSLRLLSDDESWKLLRMRLFQTTDCPDELISAGKQIAKSCRGLPLGIVAISGLLKRTGMKPDWWKQVAQTLCSHIANDPEKMCMSILELSYRHLPYYLKPCFLYLGAFVEDKEIPIRKLTWLWVAEGFIQTTGVKSLEDTAEGYLWDLIGRSLVIASKRRSDGSVKTCRVHDMLRTFCLLICEEDAFLQWNSGYDDLSSSYGHFDYGVDPNYCYPTNAIKYARRRLCICSKRNHFVMSSPFGPYVRSLLYYAKNDLYPRCPYNISFISFNFKLLRVLDLESINMGHSFPHCIEFLVHLRFLAVCGDIDSIPASIAKLQNLETLLVKGLKGTVLIPNTIWSMAKLRHVHVNNYAAFSLQDGDLKILSQLDNLVSFSSPFLFCGEDTENIMRRFPKLRKLRCLFSQSQDIVENCGQFPVLDFLTELESLKVLYSGTIAHPGKFTFPWKLKKLSLSKFRLPWDCISEIGRLPNLEALKLLSRAFEGKVWDMKEGEFLKLKFLKLEDLNIAQWIATSDSLPHLEHLILRSCRQLEDVPSGFGDIATLETIEVQLCRRSVEESVREIREQQLEFGNEELKVLINRSDWDF